MEHHIGSKGRLLLAWVTSIGASNFAKFPLSASHVYMYVQGANGVETFLVTPNQMSDLDQAKPPVTRNLHKNRDDLRGDLLLRGFWGRGTDCIIDVRVTDTDAKSNISKDPAKVLEAHEKEKKRKYLKSCLEQRRHFTPFVVSTDGLIGKEAKTLLKKLSSLLADKWEKPYSVVCGYVNAQMSIAIVRATHLCLRGSRIPTSQMSDRRPQWEGNAGLGLFRNSA
jgi:hypothetical protein